MSNLAGVLDKVLDKQGLGNASTGDEKECFRAQASFYADQHGESSLEIQESGLQVGGRRLGSASNGDENKGAGPGTSLHVTSMANPEEYMKVSMDRLVVESKTAMTSDEDVAGSTRLWDEWEEARKRMNIFSLAKSHLRQTVSTIDNYAYI
ncbi:hypothetical protein BJ878DRAFT_480002 [Calycina marina]|uniref:Uncharacterized protein n=1 Tax=Calycina marina TaxID=1763456 RepID=A0A9P8CFD7_9HELO|nr:hypothetical protein BJ878DRAFT_480002 [Calycina marina]